MEDKTKKVLFSIIVICALGILISVGTTFAYFQVSVRSMENAISSKSASFQLKLDEDVSLIKNKLIPSVSEYVDIASTRRDINGNFIVPENDNKIGTTCIDDNGNEICSIYTFTITNESKTDIPLYVTLNPNVNTFENLYMKVIDKNNNVIVPKKHLVDNRYELTQDGNYQKDLDGNWIKKANFDTLTVEPIVLSEINNLKGSIDLSNPITETYSIIMWISEIGLDQTKEDSGKLFASTLNIKSSYSDNGGITGAFSAFGTE